MSQQFIENKNTSTHCIRIRTEVLHPYYCVQFSGLTSDGETSRFRERDVMRHGALVLGRVRPIHVHHRQVVLPDRGARERVLWRRRCLLYFEVLGYVGGCTIYNLKRSRVPGLLFTAHVAFISLYPSFK